MASFTVAVGVVAMTTSGCSQPADSEQQASASTESPTYFESTPEEWARLMIACYHDAGLNAQPDPMEKGGLMVDNSQLSPEEWQRISSECDEQVGLPQQDNLSREQLLVRYEDRLSRFECLVEHGFRDDEPISFEKFVSDYERDGVVAWHVMEFTRGQPLEVYLEANETCPASGQAF